MSEQTENTQPNQPTELDDTQPIKPIKKKSRWLSILIGILGLIVLIGLGGFSGYEQGIGIRTNEEDAVLSKQLSEQYTYALVDIEFKRYETARQRLEFIVKNDPNYPGVSEKLTEVLVMMVVPTPTAMPTVTSTPDFSGAESAFERAQQLIKVQDWGGALGALDIIRKSDPNYKTAQVDGMYYFALRNRGHALILKEGNLEGGIYYLTLAERFGPLDNTSIGLREGARMYITGASFWELDWKQAYDWFSQVGSGWPSMWDGTMTASQRLQFAAMRYADDVFGHDDFCGAYELYQIASGLGNLDDAATKHSNQAYQKCYPATEVVIPTAETVVPGATTEVPPVATTEAPTDVPTDVPTATP
jgi:tetratricopeptide (TPR) repeat protein